MIALPFLPGSIAGKLYEFTTVIENTPYNFRVRWNERDVAWYFDVETEAGDVLVQGVKVVLGAYLGRACTKEFFDTGVLVARDTTRQAKDATFEDLGTRVEVLYIDALELMALYDGEVTI